MLLSSPSTVDHFFWRLHAWGMPQWAAYPSLAQPVAMPSWDNGQFAVASLYSLPHKCRLLWLVRTVMESYCKSYNHVHHMTDDTPPHPVHFQLCIQPSSNMTVHAAAKILQCYFSDACQILKQVHECLNNSSLHFRLLQNVEAYKPFQDLHNPIYMWFTFPL